MSDLDLLVRGGRDLRRVERLLLEDGYARRSGLLGGRRHSMRFTHHFEYRKGDVSVEVHWVLQRHFTLAIDEDQVWRSATRVGFRGDIYRAASDEYELVLQILGVFTDLQVGRLGLKPFVDMYRLLKLLADDLDWEAFFRRRARERLASIAAYVLALLLDVMDCGDEHPARCLRETLERRRVPRSAGLRYVLNGRRLDARQKLAALRLYETSLPRALGWWALSLPFRLAVYREGR